MHWIWSLAAAVACSPLLIAQPPDAQTKVAGRIRNSVTGLPLSKATVRLVPHNGRVGYVRTSTADGSFSFDGIAPGDYQLSLERHGFLDTAAANQAGSLVHLASGQKISSLDLLATPLAVISGIVTDADGEPVQHAVVTLISPRWSMHGRRYQDSATEDTNDLGEFRFTDLAPGRYYLYAGRPQGPEGPLSGTVKDPAGKGELVLAGRYYPNAAFVDGAAPVDLRPGQELTGIGFRLPWAPGFHVRGTVMGRDAEEIQLVGHRNQAILQWEWHDVGRLPDNTFDIAGVTAGTYYLRAATNWRTGVNLDVPVDSRDVTGLTIPASPPEFRAHVRTETGGVVLYLQREDGRFEAVTTISVRPDGTARLPGLSATRYLLWAESGDGGAYVKSVQIGQQELRTPELDFSGGIPGDLEIVMGTGAGSVEGTVEWPDPTTSAPPFAAADRIRAVLVPQEPRAGTRLVWFSEIDQNSAFRFTGIPPGKYLAFVTAEQDEGLWMNHDFVGLVQGSGTAVELAEKGSAHVKAPPLPSLVAQRAMESLR